MKRFITATALAALAAFTGVTAASAQTVKVMIMQLDEDKASLKRGNRIQNSISRVFQQTIYAPDYQRQMQQYGIQGFDVYNEDALTIAFPNYNRAGNRRPAQELISLARTIQNPKIDVLITYTAYADAVKDPFTGIAKLQGQIEYQALNMTDNRYLGGDRLTLDTAGTPFTGCAASTGTGAASPECVVRFVSDNMDIIARDAANQMALQLVAPLGRAFGNGGGGNLNGGNLNGGNLNGGVNHGGGQVGIGTGNGNGPRYANQECRNLASNFRLEFEGFDNYRISAVEQFLSSWNCAFNIDIASSSFSTTTYDYKTSADKGRLIRNIRLMMDAMGITGDVVTSGQNVIKVKAIQLRSY